MKTTECIEQDHGTGLGIHGSGSEIKGEGDLDINQDDWPGV